MAKEINPRLASNEYSGQVKRLTKNVRSGTFIAKVSWISFGRMQKL